MAKPTQDTDDDGNPIPGRSYSPSGVLQVNHATPGFSGAISDLVGALAKAFAPPQITRRRQSIDQAVDQASGSPQTNDLGDQF